MSGWNGESGAVPLSVRLVARPDLSIGRSPDHGRPRLRVSGTAAARYTIEGRVTWLTADARQPLATNTADAGGTWFFTDSSATNLAQRFYRARTVE